MRISAGLMSALFLFAAVVQYNDPDAFIWIAGYLVASGLSAAAAMGRRLLVPNAVAVAIFGIWFLSLAPTLVGAEFEAFQSFQMKEKVHEEPREAVGLLLCAIWSALLAWDAKRHPGQAEG